jgi:hypothetical protein
MPELFIDRHHRFWAIYCRPDRRTTATHPVVYCNTHWRAVRHRTKLLQRPTRCWTCHAPFTSHTKGRRPPR